MNEKHIRCIDHQIKHNQNKNILLDGNSIGLNFTAETIQYISEFRNAGENTSEVVINYAAQKALEEFCRVNQYYSFNADARHELHKIYLNLLQTIISDKWTIEEIEKEHYSNLKQWLLKTNPVAEKIFSNMQTSVEPVVCAEYSAEFQIELLRIDLNTIMQPVLDIGCGKNATLTTFLCKQGIKAYGIDRYTFHEPHLITSDWLEYNFETAKWGTIISNMSFSNHFVHHHQREDGRFIEYAWKYMQILKSLKIGGRFYYAPDLPFIEKYLDDKSYLIVKHQIEPLKMKTTIIERLQ